MRSVVLKGALLASIAAFGTGSLGSAGALGAEATSAETVKAAPRPAAILNEGTAAKTGQPAVQSPAIQADAPQQAAPAKSTAPETAATPASTSPVIAVVPEKQPTPHSPATGTAGGDQPAKTAPEEVKAAAPPAPPPPPVTTLVAEIDLTRQRMTVSEGGKVKYTWPVSTGRSGYLTPAGSFRPTWMAKMWYSKQYDDAPMPHSVFFNGGIAVHATQSTGMLGRPASHGCVRLSPSNAATFYNLVNRHTKARSRIKVVGKTPAAAVARARPPRASNQDNYASASRQIRRYPPVRVQPPSSYRYSGYGGGYTSGSRLIYPGDPIPNGYRAVRPSYRPYGGSNVYYVD